MRIIVGIGIPGSGKTTVLKSFAEKNGYAYLCPDDIRQELTGSASDQTKNADVWDEAYRRLQFLMEHGDTVVFDATFTDKRVRDQFISRAREYGAEKIQAVFVDTPLEVAKERNAARERQVPEHVLDRMQNQLNEVPPSLEDGFDAVFTLNEQHELVQAETAGEHGLLKRFMK